MIPRPTRRRRSRSVAAVLAAAAMVGLAASAAAPAAAVDATPASVVRMTPALHDEIQRRVEAFRTDNGLPGLSVAVVTPDPDGQGPVITTFAAGVPTLGSPTPVDASTQFELGSESKIFTADLLAFLVASGRVALDDPVQDFAPPGIIVPEWTDPDTGAKTRITLRDLATHEAGLSDLPPNFERGCEPATTCANPRPGYTQSMLWDAVQGYTLPWRPGTDWLYSDWGFGLLGTILANVLQAVPEPQPPAYQAALDGVFLDALGLSSTMLETPGPRLATPYADDGRPAFAWDNTNALSGGGGLISDATDMGTWVAAHLGYLPAGAPLGVRTLEDTLQPVSTVTRSCTSTTPPHGCTTVDFRMGLGWELKPAASWQVGVPWAFKDGDTAGSSTDTALAPSLRAGVTTMFNKQRETGEQLAIPLLALLVADGTPGPEPQPTAPATDPAATAAPAELAATGATTSGLIGPALGAVAILAIGIAVLRRDRRRRARRCGASAR